MHQQSPGPHRRGETRRGTAEPDAAARRKLHAGERASRSANTGACGDGLQRAVRDVRPRTAPAGVQRQPGLCREAAARPVPRR